MTLIDSQNYLKRLFENLKTQKPIVLDSERSWKKNVPHNAGCYLILQGEKPIYVGETGNLRKRINDLYSTYNHSFRRTIGEMYFRNHKQYEKASTKNKYNQEIETQLDKLLENKFRVKFLSVDLGRKELEEFIIENNDLYNKRTKRK